MSRRVILAATCGLALALGGCGAPDDLSREESRTLMDAREGLDDAIDTEEILRTSKRETARLRREVRRIVSGGAFESPQLDEFGLAALGELQLAVPSLVVTDARGEPSALDREATDAFLRHAASDPRRALLRPARQRVGEIEKVVEDTGAEEGTRIEGAGASEDTVGEVLAQAERDLDPIWPELAKRLGDAL